MPKMTNCNDLGSKYHLSCTQCCKTLILSRPVNLGSV
jgi:hypothetical protein